MNQHESRDSPRWNAAATSLSSRSRLEPIRDVENQIANELQGNTNSAGDKHLLLDFSNVKCLIAANWERSLLSIRGLIRSGGRLTLFNLSARVFELFSLTRLDTLLGICRAALLRRPIHLPMIKSSNRSAMCLSGFQRFDGI